MKESITIRDDFREIGTKTIDERSRLTLGELFKGYKRLRLLRNDRGDVLLQPVVEVPASEVWLYRNKEAFKSVRKGLREAAEGKITRVNPDKL